MFPKPEPRARTKARQQRIQAAADRAVYELVTVRDGGRCRSCGSAWQVQRHHLVPRSRVFGAERTTTANVLLLCGACHRAVHGRTLTISGTDADGRVTFEWERR